MTSHPRSRRLLATAAAALAVFLAVLVLLSVRMAGGHDPVLGAGASQPASTTVTVPQTQTAEPYESAEPYADETYGSGTYDEQSGAATAEPQTQQAPLQSGTS